MPQWNCSCRNCSLARQGKIRTRTQSCVAVSADGKSWWLINASPDLRAQIEAFPPLQPSPKTPRNSPISGVLLTNADLDHVLGLYLLREGGTLELRAPAGVLETLQLDLRLNDALLPACKVIAREPGAEFAPLTDRDDEHARLLYRALPLSAKAPPYAKRAGSGTQSVAYEIQDEATGARVVIAPDVSALTPELCDAMNGAAAVLFDGTFWSEREFAEITGRARTAADMGHLPIESGSLETMRRLKARHKIYFHINNTNPILSPGSAERAAVETAGVVVGEDGLEFEL